MRALTSIAILSAAAFAQDPQEFANPIWRTLVMGTHGMVAQSILWRRRAGLHVLEAGGNAFDAAVAVFYMTGVVEQHQAGLGGDAFILAYVGKGEASHLHQRYRPSAKTRHSRTIPKGGRNSLERNTRKYRARARWVDSTWR